ncbi:uncharacterized protein VTP21DRAFT_5502 [Calcarisporiella thermophila]|uniref:uncharacterized protein n=1 Tax=Calcarisporiella thermophila TaxID=911321 RepID=UPI003742B948
MRIDTARNVQPQGPNASELQIFPQAALPLVQFRARVGKGDVFRIPPEQRRDLRRGPILEEDTAQPPLSRNSALVTGFGGDTRGPQRDVNVATELSGSCLTAIAVAKLKKGIEFWVAMQKPESQPPQRLELFPSKGNGCQGLRHHRVLA